MTLKSNLLFVLFILAMVSAGCETVKKGGRTVGRATGEVMDTVGTVTEGGAEAVQGKVTDKENPYGR